MRHNLVVLALVLLVNIVGGVNGMPTMQDSIQLGYNSLSKTKNTISTRNLRMNSQSMYKNEEERDITVTSVLTASAKAMRMKAKLNVMLIRGLSPTRVLKKLNVVRVTDKNFNNFARYYARYLAKYSGKKADLPATAEDVIMLPKLKEWLSQKLLPSQVIDRLKDLEATNFNKCLQLYLKDADNEVMLPRLQRWRDQKLVPSQVVYNLKEVGVIDTTRYMEWYMHNGGDDIIKTNLLTWLKKGVFPQKIGQKLQKIGVTDIEEYTRIYGNIWGRKQAKLSRRNIN